MNDPLPDPNPHLQRERQADRHPLDHCFGEPVEDRNREGKTAARREPIAAGLFGFRRREP